MFPEDHSTLELALKVGDRSGWAEIIAEGCVWRLPPPLPGDTATTLDSRFLCFPTVANAAILLVGSSFCCFLSELLSDIHLIKSIPYYFRDRGFIGHNL